MRAYLIDEISPPHMERIRGFLTKNAIPSRLDRIFWVQIPDDLLSPTQFQHRGCKPHVFAIELGCDWIKLEFFVRSLRTLRCDCPGYCLPTQRDYVFRFAHSMLDKLGIKT